MEWKGTFYPENLAATQMLPFYAEQFTTTEINYTFHRIPAAKTIENWCKLTPESFRFGLKAPQKVTHFARLRGCNDTVDYFYDIVSGLGQRLGPILFQLPPNLKKDVALLEEFTQCLPGSMRAAFEFRDRSWFEDNVYAVLQKRNLCLCLADSERLTTPLISTADWGYLRLRREDYHAPDVAQWAGRVQAQIEAWSNAFVYFKHEASGIGPKLASQMRELLDSPTKPT